MSMYWDFSRDTFPKARKKYQCECCFRPIRAGSTYHRIDGKYDNKMTTVYSHIRCMRLYQHLCSLVGEWFLFSETLSVLREVTTNNRDRRKRRKELIP
jgi:hypothetical protein